MNTITLVSQEQELSTDRVMEYIAYHGGKVTRVNLEDGLSKISIRISDEQYVADVTVNDKNVSLPETTNFYRRGKFGLKVTLPQELKSLNGFLDFYSEENSLTNAFLFNAHNFTGGYVQEFTNNKMFNLLAAKQEGINIPDTIITTSKQDAKAFLEKYEKAITKPIHNGHINFTTDTTDIGSTGTTFVTLKDLDKLADSFAPMLMQNLIEKELEIRTFFFDNQFYSMAIFSQNDEQTKLDYRNYNLDKPNRNTPFALPKSLEDKLRKVLKKVGLNTASIDIILTPDHDFVFLEFNPTGQYDWVSVNCNYYLDEIIAKSLLKKK